MAWTIKYADTALKQLKKMDRQIARSIFDYLDQRVAILENPRELGKKLVGPQYGEYWRYRTGDLRIICDIKNQNLIILVIDVGHRKEIYR